MLESFFDLDVDRDVDVVEKEKETASNVTRRLVDTILAVPYPFVESSFERLRDGGLFVPAVYLYCLRPFAALPPQLHEHPVEPLNASPSASAS